MALPNPRNPFGLPNLVPPIRPDAGKGVAASAPSQASRVHYNGEGLIARFEPIKGVTPKKVLDHRFWLPAVLNTVTVTETALHSEYDTLSAGQFSQAAMGPVSATQLRDLPLDTLTLDTDAVWLPVVGQNPHNVRVDLFTVMRARKPVRLLLYFWPAPGVGNELDMLVTLRQATREIRPAERDTRYITVTVKEWRDPRVTVHTSHKSTQSHRTYAQTKQARKRGVELPATHLMNTSDTLESLAFAYYGRYDYWRYIRDANGIPTRWGQKTPLYRMPGFSIRTKLRIPAVSTPNAKAS